MKVGVYLLPKWSAFGHLVVDGTLLIIIMILTRLHLWGVWALIVVVGFVSTDKFNSTLYRVQLHIRWCLGYIRVWFNVGAEHKLTLMMILHWRIVCIECRVSSGWYREVTITIIVALTIIPLGSSLRHRHLVIVYTFAVFHRFLFRFHSLSIKIDCSIEKCFAFLI